MLTYLKQHHVALFALFIALGGTAYATVGTGARSNIHACVDRSTGAVRIARHCQRGERGISWAKVGPRGPIGMAGPVGPSNGYYSAPGHRLPQANPDATVSVPAGNYLATGGCGVSYFGPNGAGPGQTPTEFAQARSDLSASTTSHGQPVTEVFSSRTSVPDSGSAPGETGNLGTANLTTSGAFSLPNGGTLTEHCSGNDTSISTAGVSRMIFNSHLSVIRVRNLNGFNVGRGVGAAVLSCWATSNSASRGRDRAYDGRARDWWKWIIPTLSAARHAPGRAAQEPE